MTLTWAVANQELILVHVLAVVVIWWRCIAAVFRGAGRPYTVTTQTGSDDWHRTGALIHLTMYDSDDNACDEANLNSLGQTFEAGQ